MKTKQDKIERKRISVKIISLILIVTMTALLFVSCKNSITAKEVITNFLYISKKHGNAYFSTSDASGDGYIDGEMVETMFNTEIDRFKVSEFAFLFCMDNDSLEEFGVFVTDSSQYRLELCDIISRRLDLLEKSVKKCSTFIKHYGRITVYAFCEDEESAKNIFDSILL